MAKPRIAQEVAEKAPQGRFHTAQPQKTSHEQAWGSGEVCSAALQNKLRQPLSTGPCLGSKALTQASFHAPGCHCSTTKWPLWA